MAPGCYVPTLAVFIRRASEAAAQAAGAAQSGRIGFFPFFDCARASSSFSFASAVTSMGGGQFCFTLIAANCTRNRCCNTDVRKIEVRGLIKQGSLYSNLG